MAIYTRLAKREDLPAIMDIIADAKAFLKASGSTQWQSGYPDQRAILTDILSQNGYCLIDGQEIVGYAAVIVGPDPNYQKIVGSWTNEEDPYATIHRIALSQKFQGKHLAGNFFSNLLSLQVASGIHNFRVDTMKQNLPMQALAKKQGFKEQGIIQVEDPIDPNRIAFELNL